MHRSQQTYDIKRIQIQDSFHIVSAHAPNSLVRVISARLHVKGQPLYSCLTLHNGIWKTIKRKINPQIKIRQIVKLNDKCNKKVINSNIPNI